ncbi:MAG: hypothetical protein ABI723_11015 [Bacteroidia bacterium]
MKSVTTERFRKAYDALPEHVRVSALKAYKLWHKNPLHPSLKFKRIHSTKPVYSVRVSLSCRALGIKQDETIIWFWIGSHADYNKLIIDL